MAICSSLSLTQRGLGFTMIENMTGIFYFDASSRVPSYYFLFNIKHLPRVNYLQEILGENVSKKYFLKEHCNANYNNIVDLCTQNS